MDPTIPLWELVHYNNIIEVYNCNSALTESWTSTLDCAVAICSNVPFKEKIQKIVFSSELKEEPTRPFPFLSYGS